VGADEVILFIRSRYGVAFKRMEAAVRDAEAAGVIGKLIRAHGDREEDRPLLDALLNLTPGMHQAMAVMDEGWALTAKAVPTVMGMGGIADSCYMWRRGGALDRIRKEYAARDTD